MVANTTKKKTDAATVGSDRRGKHNKQRRWSDRIRENI